MSNGAFFIFSVQGLALMTAIILLFSSLHQRGVESSMKRQFGVCTLLITMTGVAVVLGSIVYAARK